MTSLSEPSCWLAPFMSKVELAAIERAVAAGRPPVETGSLTAQPVDHSMLELGAAPGAVSASRTVQGPVGLLPPKLPIIRITVGREAILRPIVTEKRLRRGKTESQSDRRRNRRYDPGLVLVVRLPSSRAATVLPFAGVTLEVMVAG